MQELGLQPALSVEFCKSIALKVFILLLYMSKYVLTC